MTTEFNGSRADCLGGVPRRVSSLLLFVLSLSLAFAAATAPSALAAEPTTFALAGDGAGQINGPQGITVDQPSENVYIADTNNQRIDEFDADGGFLRAFGFGVRTAAPALEECTAATDCAAALPGSFLVDAGVLRHPAGIAASGGHIWVSEDHQRLTELDATGEIEALRVVGGDVVAHGPDDSGVDEVQNATVEAEGGTFKLALRINPVTGREVEDTETADLPYNAGPAEVESALDALPTIGGLGGSVTVTGGPGDATGSSPYRISFGGNLAGDFISELTPIEEELTGTVHTLTVSVVAKGGAPEVCVPANGDFCKIGTSGTADGQFQQPRAPLAVDASGDVWVGDQNRVQELAPDGAHLTNVALPGHGATRALAVNPAGTKVYVVSGEAAFNTSVRVYETATGIELGSPIDDLPGEFKALALGPGENLFVADRQAFGEPAVFREFSPTGEQIGQFGAAQVFGTEGPTGIAMGAGALYSISAGENNSYAAQRFPLPGPGPLAYGETSNAILPTTATLKAIVGPEGNETTYHFEYGTDETYGHSTPAETLSPGFYDEAIEASLGGLIPSTTYHFRLIAEDSKGHTTEGPDRTFTTLPAVQIENESAADVSATGVTFQADLNPLGAAAEWWVEYGSESYGSVTARASLGAGFGPVAVSVHVANLTPGTTYHYRFVASDEREGAVYTTDGEDRTLTTQPGASPSGLLDGRAWEMVTPSAKPGPIRPLELEGLVEAAAGGGAFAYLTTPLGEEAQGAQPTNQVLAARDPNLGWQSRDLALPQDKVAGERLGNTDPYRQLSPDLAEALVQQAPEDATLLSPEASEKTPYLRRLAPCQTNAPGCYTPLVTGKEGAANVPPGTEFGRAAAELEFAGATPDLEHVALTANIALTADPAPEGGLYEWSAATRSLRLASVLPGGGAAPEADLGTQPHKNVRHAISADGSRVVFASQNHLYLRDSGREETAQLDAVQGGVGSGGASAVFQTAGADDSRVFFTSEQKLTAGSGAAEGKPDLYVCDLGPEGATGPLGCSLADLTPRTGAGESAAVRGTLPGAGDDGSIVYFVANGALAPKAASGTCKPGGPEGDAGELCNLYALRFTAGAWQAPHLIAVLSTEDQNDWGREPEPSPRFLTARVSPNGHWLAFMSNRPLTGEENRDALSNERDEQVFLYDADSNRLRCASCNPSGARPQGARIVGEEPETIVDAQGAWQHRWLAANVPGWTNASGNNFLHQPRYLSDAGRLFFNSPDALVPDDGNGTWDVYEFEPAGSGGCTGAEPHFEPGNDGCLALVSSGNSTRASTFMDASESGDDVFFLTSAKLASQDSDTAADVYDAHVCSAASPCLAPAAPAAPCADSTTCQGPVQPAPGAETPATANLHGRGNPHRRNRCRAGGRGGRARHRHQPARHCKHAKGKAGR